MPAYRTPDRKQTKAQQVQFFEDCLLPNYDAPLDHIDLEADVDSTLTTMENWEELQETYNIDTQDDADLLEAHEDYEEMADRYYEDRQPA